MLDVDAGVGELLQFPADQPERAGADTDDILLRQGREHDALAIDEGAVMAVKVDDAVCAGHVAQFGVVAGDGRVGDDDVVVERPADAQRLGGQWPDHARVARGRPAGRVQTGSPDDAAQDRPVCGMAKPDLALPVDLDPVYPSVSGISAVGAAVVHQQPMTVVQAKHSMLPRHAGISDHDVALRIATDPVRRALPAGSDQIPGSARRAMVRTPPEGTSRSRANSRAIHLKVNRISLNGPGLSPPHVVHQNRQLGVGRRHTRRGARASPAGAQKLRPEFGGPVGKA